jgi:hypothetical protein
MSGDSLFGTIEDDTVHLNQKPIGLSNLAPRFQERAYPHFVVEVGDEGPDFVYHFWPPGSAQAFCHNFHRYLEDAFREILPPGLPRPRAKYVNRHESAALMKHNQKSGGIDVGAAMGMAENSDNKIALDKFKLDRDSEQYRTDWEKTPKETYWVRVFQGGTVPFGERFLKERVFELIERNIVRGIHAG